LYLPLLPSEGHTCTLCLAPAICREIERDENGNRIERALLCRRHFVAWDGTGERETKPDNGKDAGKPA
jgi:hypothetical protein